MRVRPSSRFAVSTSLVLSLGALVLLGPGCDGSSPTSPSPPGTTCSFQVTAPTQTFGPDATSSTVTVTTTAQCSWTARVDVSWVSIGSGASGTGPGTVTLNFTANPGESAREATVTVAEQPLRMTQQGRAKCDVALAAQSDQFGPEGGTHTVALSAGAGCAWAVAVSESWLSVSPMSGTGSATLSYKAVQYTGIPERRAEIRVGDKTMLVDQDGDVTSCQYSVVPTEMTLHWHQESSNVRLTAQAGCPWTVRAAEGWLNLSSPPAATGDGTIEFRPGIFTQEALRKAPLEIRWPTATAGQNVWVTQEGCRYTITTATSVTVPAGLTLAETWVIEQAMSVDCMRECPWTAVPTVPWIRIVSGSPSAGYSKFTYEVQANTTGSARTGSIRVMDKTVTITQLP